MAMSDLEHFNQPTRRKAEFIKLPNTLKNKVGGGGLSENILNKAQALLENNTTDFRPLGEMYLDALSKGLDQAKNPAADANMEDMISTMLYPSMQMKANGGMFHYPLVTSIADLLIHFLEVIEKLDEECLEIIQAFHTTLRAILLGQIKGNGGQRGKELHDALSEACFRYFEKHPDNREEKEYEAGAF